MLTVQTESIRSEIANKEDVFLLQAQEEQGPFEVLNLEELRISKVCFFLGSCNQIMGIIGNVFDVAIDVRLNFLEQCLLDIEGIGNGFNEGELLRTMFGIFS